MLSGTSHPVVLAIIAVFDGTIALQCASVGAQTRIQNMSSTRRCMNVSSLDRLVELTKTRSDDGRRVELFASGARPRRDVALSDSQAEGTGLEPATGFPAPHFQCGR